MGLELVVPRAAPLALGGVLERLAAAGLPGTVAMVDQVLLGPGATLPVVWRDARIRTPAGMVTLRRTASGVAVIVFGNADDRLLAAQRLVATAIRELP